LAGDTKEREREREREKRAAAADPHPLEVGGSFCVEAFVSASGLQPLLNYLKSTAILSGGDSIGVEFLAV
jgi:hypothetical protein